MCTFAVTRFRLHAKCQDQDKFFNEVKPWAFKTYLLFQCIENKFVNIGHEQRSYIHDQVIYHCKCQTVHRNRKPTQSHHTLKQCGLTAPGGNLRSMQDNLYGYWIFRQFGKIHIMDVLLYHYLCYKIHAMDGLLPIPLLPNSRHGCSAGPIPVVPISRSFTFTSMSIFFSIFMFMFTLFSVKCMCKYCHLQGGHIHMVQSVVLPMLHLSQASATWISEPLQCFTFATKFAA